MQVEWLVVYFHSRVRFNDTLPKLNVLRDRASPEWTNPS